MTGKPSPPIIFVPPGHPLAGPVDEDVIRRIPDFVRAFNVFENDIQSMCVIGRDQLLPYLNGAPAEPLITALDQYAGGPIPRIGCYTVDQLLQSILRAELLRGNWEALEHSPRHKPKFDSFRKWRAS